METENLTLLRELRLSNKRAAERISSILEEDKANEYKLEPEPQAQATAAAQAGSQKQQQTQPGPAAAGETKRRGFLDRLFHGTGASGSSSSPAPAANSSANPNTNDNDSTGRAPVYDRKFRRLLDKYNLQPVEDQDEEQLGKLKERIRSLEKKLAQSETRNSQLQKELDSLYSEKQELETKYDLLLRKSDHFEFEKMRFHKQIQDMKQLNKNYKSLLAASSGSGSGSNSTATPPPKQRSPKRLSPLKDFALRDTLHSNSYKNLLLDSTDYLLKYEV